MQTLKSDLPLTYMIYFADFCFDFYETPLTFRFYYSDSFPNRSF